VHTVRARINSISHRTLDPRSRFIRMWDMITIFALAYTAFVTPFEVAFFEPSLFSGPFNFFFNRLVDAIFLCDIAVNFFLPYRETPRRGGMMVYDNRRILRNCARAPSQDMPTTQSGSLTRSPCAPGAVSSATALLRLLTATRGVPFLAANLEQISEGGSRWMCSP
jgi:hypothetical protein